MSVKSLACFDCARECIAVVEVVAVAIVFATHSITTDNEAGVATGWLDG